MNRSVIYWLSDAWRLSRPFWLGPQRYRALAYLGLTLICGLLQVYAAVRINKWNMLFYNAIQNYDKIAFFNSLYQYWYILLFYVVTLLGSYYYSALLEIHWRQWLTRYYLSEWLHRKAFYRSRFTKQASQDNPDQRISEDIKQFIQLSLELSLGAFHSLVSLTSFVIILWGLSGNFKFHLANHSFVIHGYMVWVALFYSLTGTYLTFFLGRKLIPLNYKMERYEANFRYKLVRIREYGETILSYQGMSAEQKIVTRDFDNIVDNFRHSITRNLKLNSFSYFIGQVSILVPTLISASHYFAKEITLGNMMQINSAFARVESSIAYFMYVFLQIAKWRAVVERLLDFQIMLAESSAVNEPVRIQTAGKVVLELKDVEISLPNGRVLLKKLNFSLCCGERLLIQGSSGVGKSTLLRSINGLWPFFRGEVNQKSGLRSLFIAQKAYLPLTYLKQAICYPQCENLPSDAEVKQIMQSCGLSSLVGQLHQSHDWGSVLSIGEQQRLAFCRILLMQPDIIYLDEASSALDSESELELYRLLIEQLPQSILISISHHASLLKLHHKIIEIPGSSAIEL